MPPLGEDDNLDYDSQGVSFYDEKDKTQYHSAQRGGVCGFGL
jgi:hypothetical protein